MKVMGDTHSIRVAKNLIERNNITDDVLIHVGDFGLGFSDLATDMKQLLDLDDLLINRNVRMRVIRGNHDNPVFWQPGRIKLPRFHNLNLMPDYSVELIEGKTVLYIGGAISIDRIVRIEDQTWWPDEEFNYDLYMLSKAVTSIKAIGGDLDLVISHTAPDFCYPIGHDNPLVNHYIDLENKHGFMDRNLNGELCQERENIAKLHDHLVKHHKTPKKWCYGHFHSYKMQTLGKTEFTLLGINEVKDIF